jgi:hypothetical protein
MLRGIFGQYRITWDRTPPGFLTTSDFLLSPSHRASVYDVWFIFRGVYIDVGCEVVRKIINEAAGLVT